ncbi:exodeoxyribonuclease VII large subunit [Pararhodospirillum oryzae]|uniref:Exodeoxyribonuclease 7 large subunit n=1 Tax=Pararhodospirillum oryzae TaxID=478448 RepID=A0A512H848_9PROT|nr:exodeoxyribonuclease VII large subunit [Pararhodospirillum oryzae]GEO81629.1 exodeoxyribonuclease 7 large subunit [Pararhodospirillum oryzae]
MPSEDSLSHNLPTQSVSELSGALKRTVEESFARVRVRGEVSQPKTAGSGHCYLRLKDDQAVLDAIIWRGTLTRLGVRPEEGLEVIATGRLTTYPGRSSYQLIIEGLELAGEGALLKLLEERRRRLAAEGLFDEARKRPLPFLPRVIGVVTSPTGAVIRDILHRLADRFPVSVLVWPVAVQGEAAAAQVAQAIAGFNALPPDGPVPRPDLLIVARGGGSLEDLMAFNDEGVVRAAAASTIPLIAAIGHETDVTLIDHAADRRAPTPTGAAEMAVPVRQDLRAHLATLGQRLETATARGLDERTRRIEGLARGLPNLAHLLDTHVQRLDDRAERLRVAILHRLTRETARVDQARARLRHPADLIARKHDTLAHLAQVLAQAGPRQIRDAARALERLSTRLRPDPLVRRLAEGQRHVSQAGERLETALNTVHTRKTERLEALGARLESVSYRAVLKRGYAVVRGPAQGILDSAGAVQPGMALSLEWHDGRVEAVATPPSAPPAPRARGRRPASPRQGDLLDGL